MALIQLQRHILSTGDPASQNWLEIQDWRGRGKDEPGIEIAAKHEGPSAVGEEDITVWLTTEEATELSEVLDRLLERQGMVVDYES